MCRLPRSNPPATEFVVTRSRIVFAGTPDFALASLKALVEADLVPIAVFTQPDRPAGRGRRMTASPVKTYAIARQLDLRQPTSLKDPDVVQQLADLQADVMVVAAYGLILPQAVLDLPRRGCVNVHASLLPRWRGAAPIQAAILAGDLETGISLMQMDAGLDTGPVFVRERIAIDEHATATDVHDRLAGLGGSMLAEHLPAILEGRLSAEPQLEAEATYAGKIRSADARIDWGLTAAYLQRQVRAYNPVPGARFDFGGETIKCWQAEVGGDNGRPHGTVLRAGADGIDIACGEGSLRLTRLQRPGRKPVSAGEFAAQLDLADRRFT